MKQATTGSSPVRIRRELLDSHIAAIKRAGGFDSDVQAINRFIECCGPVFVAVLQHQSAVLESLATGLPLPALTLPSNSVSRQPPRAMQGIALDRIDPSQLDDF